MVVARERVHIEWQTKVLASFIAQTVQSEKGARELLKEVERLSLFKQPEGEKSTRPADSSAGSNGAAPVSGASARPGSYERLMAGFGGGRISR